MKKLSIIISNRNDTAMLSVTVNSCIEELRPLGLKNCEIIICDNSDEQLYAQLNSCLPVGYIKEGVLKIFRQDFPCLFTARETAIEHSSAEYVCCIDSHMVIGRNMFVDLYNFMRSKKDDKTLGFAHAPINWSHHHQRSAVHDRDMAVNELGNWNKAYDRERTITWKGMPWICRKDWFLDKVDGLGGYGALSQYNVSWGGGDMHIGIKPWLLGFKNWAVPTNAGIHIGPFPKINLKSKNPSEVDTETHNGYKYRLYGKSGNGPHTVGFLVSCYVLGGEDMMNRNKAAITKRFGRYLNLDEWWQRAMDMGKDEKAWLDKRKIMTFEQLLKRKPWEDSTSEPAQTKWYQQFIIDGKPTTNRPFMTDEYFNQLRPLFPDDLSDKKVLDLACNAGLVSFNLAKLGAKVIGVDKDKQYIDQAHYVMSKLDVPKVEFIISDLEDLPIDDYPSDIILMLSTIYHLNNPKAMIEKVCNQPSDIVASFRLNNYDKYIGMFKDYGRTVVKETTYARKRAALLR